MDAKPYYMLNKSEYSFFSLGARLNDKFAVALSRNNFAYNQYIDIYTNGRFVPTNSTPHNTNLCMTIAYQSASNISVGFNVNHFSWQPYDKPFNSIELDLGVLKKIDFKQKEKFRRSLNLALSLSNFNFAKIKYLFTGYKIDIDLPAILRIGAGYKFDYKKSLSDSLKTLEMITHLEFREIINTSKGHSSLRLGVELKFFELLVLRCGYSAESLIDNGYSQNESFNSFTYGGGLQLPLYRFTNIPLKLSLDYTNLPQPNYNYNSTVYENFQSVNLKIVWLFSGKRN